MFKIRDLTVSCVLVLALLLSGCGKKKNKSIEQKKVALRSDDSNMMLASPHIPIAEEEIDVDEFFIDDIAEFAFAGEDDLDSEETYKFSEMDADDSLFNENNIEEDESLFVAWDEEVVQDLNFQTVHFDLNKNEIRNDQLEFVKQDIDAAKNAIADGKSIVVQGHACQMGPPSYNLSLSERRADVIRKEMVKNGIPEEKVKIIGCGQEIPVVWSEEIDKQKLIKELEPNRRVEITVS